MLARIDLCKNMRSGPPQLERRLGRDWFDIGNSAYAVSPE